MKRTILAVTAMALATLPASVTAAYGSTEHGRSAPAREHQAAPPPATALPNGGYGWGCTQETHQIAGSPASTAYYCRAGAYQWVNSAGAAITTSVLSPNVATDDNHSLLEIAVESTRGT